MRDERTPKDVCGEAICSYACSSRRLASEDCAKERFLPHFISRRKVRYWNSWNRPFSSPEPPGSTRVELRPPGGSGDENGGRGAAIFARLGFTVYLVVSHSSALIRSI